MPASVVQSSSTAKRGRKTKKKKKVAQVLEDIDARGNAAEDEEDLDKILSELNIQTVSVLKISHACHLGNYMLLHGVLSYTERGNDIRCPCGAC